MPDHSETLPLPDTLLRLAGGDPGEKRCRGGTHRVCAPEETLARAVPLMGRFGITRIANLTGLDRIGLPVVMVCRPNARSTPVAQGKGLDLAAAKASGLMESIETFHAERIERPIFYGSETDLTARHHDGPQRRPVDVARLPQVEGDRYDRARPMLWIEGLDLMGGEAVWLPYEPVHANYALPLPPGSGCFVASTNGLASGNHLLEATCHALCEVIERDSTSLFHRLSPKERQARRIDPDTVNDPGCRAILDRLEATGFSVAIWDTTSDLGIPSIDCMILDERSAEGHPGFGAGCHLAPEIALLRALSEAVQVRTTYISGARDDLSHDEFGRAAIAEKVETARRLAAGPAPARGLSALPRGDGESFAEDLTIILSRLRARDLAEAALVDLSLPGLGFSVVRVVVPGLEGPDDDETYLPGARARKLAGGKGEGAP